MFPTLLPRDVHLWWVDTCRPSDPIDVLALCLAPDERRRAERFIRDTDRHRFVVSHAAARMILGRYLGIPPERVEMTIRPGGKPQLAPSVARSSLCYNLSHSEERAIIGVTRDREIGVDVEYIRPLSDVENIVSRYFSPREQATWRSLPTDERLAAFFRCWTRKEAYLKARGIGLSAGLDRFDVSLSAGEPARLLRVDDAGESVARWQMHDIPAGNDYTAACVVDGEVEEISVLDWPLLSVTPL